MTIRPIFVIGKNRSGTKWLSNTISNHSKIACVRSHEFGGILETNVFFNMPNTFGDLAIKENLIGFIEAFKATSFFKLTSLNEQVLYDFRGSDYSSFFRFMMNRYAENQKKRIWLQKTNPYLLGELCDRYPDAKFICITRDVVDNIRSTIGLHMRESEEYRKNITKEVFRYALQTKLVHRYSSSRDRVIVLRFQDLKDKRHSTCERICDFLELPFEDTMLEDIYAKNTSFRGEIAKGSILSQRETLIIRSLYSFFKILPLKTMQCIYQFGKRIQCIRDIQNSGPVFIRGTFELRRQEIELEKGNEPQ